MSPFTPTKKWGGGANVSTPLKKEGGGGYKRLYAVLRGWGGGGGGLRNVLDAQRSHFVAPPCN